METKHTPGNWAIGKSDSVVVSDRIPDDYSLNGGHDDTEYYGGFCICESIAKKADAKLIAAAPDLLEASIENLKFLEWIASMAREFNMWSNKVQLLHERIAKTREAIEKATE